MKKLDILKKELETIQLEDRLEMITLTRAEIDPTTNTACTGGPDGLSCCVG